MDWNAMLDWLYQLLKKDKDVPSPLIVLMDDYE